MLDVENVDMIMVKLGGQELLLLQKDYDKAASDAIDQVKGYAAILRQTYKVTASMEKEYLDTARLRSGFIVGFPKALVLAISMKAKDVKFPNPALSGRAGSALSKLEAAVSGKKIAVLAAAIVTAEKEMNAYRDELDRFAAELQGGAKRAGLVLSVASAAGFVVLGAMGGSILVAGGATAMEAGAISAGCTKTLQNSIDLFGKAVNGQSIDLPKSAEKNAIDSVVALASGAISATKVDEKLLANSAKIVAGKICAKFSYLPASLTEGFVLTFLTASAGAGHAFVTSALSQTTTAMGDMLKKRKIPTEKDFSTYFDNVMVGMLASLMMKNFEIGDKKFQASALKVTTEKLVPDAVKKLVSGGMPATKEMKDLADAVFRKTVGSLLKSGMTEAVKVGRSSDSPDKLAEIGAKKITTDSVVLKLIEAATRDEMKKKKIPTK